MTQGGIIFHPRGHRAGIRDLGEPQRRSGFPQEGRGSSFPAQGRTVEAVGEDQRPLLCVDVWRQEASGMSRGATYVPSGHITSP